MVVSELERLHSHILWAGIAAKLMGFKTMFMSCFAIREKVMDALEVISGNRVNYGMNCFGGVNRDITDPQAVLNIIDVLEKEITREIIPVFTTDKTVASRCAGIGVLTNQQAVVHGHPRAPRARFGSRQGFRRDAPYLAYDRMEFSVPVQQDGDVRARLVVRALEMLESCKIIRQTLNTLPAGSFKGPDPVRVKVPAGNALARIEAPRGEVFYSVTSNGTDTPARVRVRTPTFMNMPTVRFSVLRRRVGRCPADSGLHRSLLFLHRPIDPGCGLMLPDADLCFHLFQRHAAAWTRLATAKLRKQVGGPNNPKILSPQKVIAG